MPVCPEKHAYVVMPILAISFLNFAHIHSRNVAVNGPFQVVVSRNGSATCPV